MAADAREESRWFIKSRDDEKQIKACQKSIDAAKRKGNTRMVTALEAKLAKLLPSSPVSVRDTASSKPVDVLAPRVKRRKKLIKKVPSKAPSSDDDDDEAVASDGASDDGADRKAAEDLLLKATARAAEVGSESDSGSEADAGCSGARRTKKNWWDDAELKCFMKAEGTSLPLEPSDEEEEEEELSEEEEEEPVPTKKRKRKASASDAKAANPSGVSPNVVDAEEAADASEDSDFFDASGDELDTAAAPVANEDAAPLPVSAGSTRREKKLRRKARRMLMKERAAHPDWHPSWAAARKPKVSGRLPKRRSRSTAAVTQTFDSGSES